MTTQNVGSGTSYFIHSDWLGTERVRTNLSGTATETCTSLTYGDDLSCTGTDVSPLHFTGKMRDAETSLDEFPARYYSSAQGRWYSPDWASAQVPVPYADLHNPQSLNLYDYVGSDPTNHADADGHLQDAPGGDRDRDLQEQEQDKKAQADTTKAQNTTDWSLSWQVSASANFLGEEVKGVWDATGGALLDLGKSVLNGDAEKNIATTAEWAVTSPGKIGEALKEGGHEVAQTIEAAFSGNPRAIGQVVGTAATVAYTAENVRVGAYEHGGGGANLKNTLFNGNRLAVDYHPFGKAGTATASKNVLHVDIKIQQLGINVRHWTP
jgi:RHS repeat-associated protein